MIAGVAILLMVGHHLFTYPDWLIDGVSCHSVFGKWADNLVWLVGRLGNICIYLFAFQSGYSLYERHDLYDTPKKRFHRIFTFLMAYWIICAAFWIFGLIFNEAMPSVHQALLNMFGIEVGFFSHWINVAFAWYVLYYILLVISSPILYKCFSSKRLIIVLSSIFISVGFISLLSALGIVGYWEPLMSSIIGILAARYRIFEWANNYFHTCRGKDWWLAGLLLGSLALRALMLFCGRKIPDNAYFPVIESIMEATIALVFIFSFLSLIKRLNNRPVSAALIFLGGLSMSLWFLHGIIFTGSRFLQKFFYFPQEPILILLLTLAIFIPISMGFQMISNLVKK